MVEPPYRIKNMVPGMIMLWNGTIATVPSGWHICDGTMGTPDLRNRFVYGAEVDDAGVAKATITSFLAQTGGSRNHGHTYTGDGHAHDLNAGNQIEDISPNGDYSHHTDTNPSTGDTSSSWHVPLCYVLCYIMKL